MSRELFENVDDMRNVVQDAIHKMGKDLRVAASTLTVDEARFLVDYYYQLQADRIRAKAQMKQLKKTGEPNEVIGWLKAMMIAARTSDSS